MGVWRRRRSQAARNGSAKNKENESDIFRKKTRENRQRKAQLIDGNHRKTAKLIKIERCENREKCRFNGGI